MQPQDRIFVAGARGLVGSAVVRCLQQRGFTNLLTPGHKQVDLADKAAVEAFFAANKPNFVVLAAAKVGGIVANNTYPGDFIRENLAIELNVIDAAYRYGVEKLVFLGSSCIYPRLAPQPIREDYLMTGPLEPTNSAYAVAKIAGMEMIRAYRRQFGFKGISLMPTNMYGPHDNYDLQNSHVLPALIRKFHDAKRTNAAEAVVWGTGQPRRELMYADDLADAILFMIEHYDDDEHVNIGTGEDVTIAELAQLVSDTVGFQGKIVFDTSKPDGMPRKQLDVTRAFAMGWRPKVKLADGIARAYQAFLTEHPDLAGVG